MNCVFCKIINGEIPAYTVYDDELVKVILDANPVSDGHLLIIPKEHITDINEINDELFKHINLVAKEMYELLKERLEIEGLTLVQNNGYGQEVKHYHMHLIPRYSNDNIHMTKTTVRSTEEVYDLLQ